MLSAAVSTVLAWLTSKGAALIVGALCHVVSDLYQSYLTAQAQEDRGRLAAERDEATRTAAAETRIAEAGAASDSEDDAINALAGGKG